MTPAPITDEELFELFKSFKTCRGVVLAVSGGADSTALMVLAARWRDNGAATPLSVATIDHGLRPESAGECQSVAAQARALGFDTHILKWTGEKPLTRIQEQARHARFRLLAGQAKNLGWDGVATAHTLDDQAETVMMRLMRGSGIDGLAAMRAETERDGVRYLRPFLGLEKSRLVATLQAASRAWIEDPSNADVRYERVRVRRLLSTLERNGLSARRLATLAGRAARAATALEAAVDGFFTKAVESSKSGHAIHAALFFAEADEIQLRVLARAIAALQPPRERPAARLERLETLLADLQKAGQAARPCRRTCAGALIALQSDGVLAVKREGERRRRPSP